MMKHKKLLAVGLALATAVTVFSAACDANSYVKMSYYDETTYEEGSAYSTINENLFYRNNRKVDIADPCVVYIGDENDPDYGSYYLYGTSSSKGFCCWKSKNLINWDMIGFVLFYRDATSLEGRCLTQDTWAPEVIYDEENSKWYMFFSSTPGESNYKFIPYVAVSDSPRGPFTLIDHVEDYKTTDGTPLKEVEGLDENPNLFFQRFMTFDPYSMYQAMERLDILSIEPGCDLMRAIDFHPYVDPDTHEKYLYFTCNKNNSETFIMGMKMNGWDDPDYSTLTKLTRTRYATTDPAGQVISYEQNNRINEGAWINKHNGKYYLSFSINSYSDRSYAVCQAVADSPLGPYRKLEESEGGILLSTDAQMMDNVSGPGHHSIISVEGKDYILYHKHNSVAVGGGNRHASLDEIKWVTVKDVNGNDLDVMYTNGPTTTVQPLPDFASEYKNIAAEGTVKATSVAKDSSASYLTDGLLSVYRYANHDMVESAIKETQFTEKTTITVDFSDYRTIRALMVYNSKYMESAFYNIERVEFDCLLEDGTYVTKYIDDLKFDLENYTSKDDPDVLRPAAAAIAEFNEIKCKTIRITVSPATQEQISVHGMDDHAALAISEIKILGK